MIYYNLKNKEVLRDLGLVAMPVAPTSKGRLPGVPGPVDSSGRALASICNCLLCSTSGASDGSGGWCRRQILRDPLGELAFVSVVLACEFCLCGPVWHLGLRGTIAVSSL